MFDLFPRISQRDAASKFGVIALFLNYEQSLTGEREMTKSPWLIIDDNESERSTSPVPEKFYYFIWNTIFSD